MRSHILFLMKRMDRLIDLPAACEPVYRLPSSSFNFLRNRSPFEAFCFPPPAAAALPRLFPPRCIRKEGGVFPGGQATRLLPSLDIFDPAIDLLIGDLVLFAGLPVVQLMF